MTIYNILRLTFKAPKLIVVLMLILVFQAKAYFIYADSLLYAEGIDSELKTQDKNDVVTAEEEQRDIERLMSVIERQTDIATKTRMNVDFVPDIMTVL
ncbi:MAG: hypothetical protein HQK96_19140, partial [Nitrospirae bacterium]|nr:hypothetical protein [Nitrospirota bacterium]